MPRKTNLDEVAAFDGVMEIRTVDNGDTMSFDEMESIYDLFDKHADLFRLEPGTMDLMFD